MKKILTLTIMCLFGINISFAQTDSKMCGTWSGMYRENIFLDGSVTECDVQLVIRISKSGENYRVRVKRNNKKNGKTYYDATCHVVSSQSNSVSWYVEDPHLEYDADDDLLYTARSYWTVAFDGSDLIVNETLWFLDSYYTNGEYKKRETTLPNGQENHHNIVLYRDEDDW